MIDTLHAAALAIHKGAATPVDLLEQCLERIERWEPRVRAWVFIDKDGARAEAKRLGDELKRGYDRGPLHGIPVGIKDIFDVIDWPTAAGSKLWANCVARRDAVVVERLRRAGAIFLGKTVTTAYASFDPPITRNPWDLERTPGGSSSGSAAALACSMCLGATGSQTGGSITRPASYCGVAGLKPTFGLVSCDGVVPLAPSMDHPGPMARCVKDLAILFQAMTEGGPDYMAAVDEPPRPVRLGRLRGLFEDRAAPVVRDMMERVIRQLQERGAIVRDVALPAAFSEIILRHRIVMTVEAAAFHEKRLRDHPDDYPPRIRSLLDEGLACSAAEYARTKDHQKSLREEMARCFEEVDALLAPAIPGPAPDASTTGDPVFNSPWSYTGLPVVSFPAGLSPERLPLAIQLAGQARSEASLLATSLWCERALEVTPLSPDSIS
jgi:Asp-tRNA(Asn)/Glu-tRNA(Gln) amidotransferase A subunit family amidase